MFVITVALLATLEGVSQGPARIRPVKEPVNRSWVASAFRRKDAAVAEFEQHSSAARGLPAEAGSHTSVSSTALDQNQGNQPARRTRPPDTDETVAVTKGTRLSVNNFAGEVQIRGWDKDAVRVQAFHNPRSRIAIKPGNAALSVSSSGTPSAVDYEISVPSWMPVKIEGTYIYIAVEGTQADVSAETVRGDIVLKGGAAVVTAKSVEGEVILEGVRGRINASSINQGVTVNGATGELSAETVNGHIALNNIEATSVEVASVNGNIRYDGS